MVALRAQGKVLRAIAAAASAYKVPAPSPSGPRLEIGAQRLDQPVCVAGAAGGPIDVEIRPHEYRVHSGFLQESQELAVRVDDGVGRAGFVGDRYDLSAPSLDEGGRLRRHADSRRQDEVEPGSFQVVQASLALWTRDSRMRG